MNGNSSNTGNRSNLNDKTHVVEQQQQHLGLLLPMVPQITTATKETKQVLNNTTSDITLFYISHLFHASVYYYCIKYIFNTIIIPSSNDDNNNIISSLAFYGIYHRTPYNQFIHFFGVPFIIWTMLIYGAHLPFTNHPKFIVYSPTMNTILPQSLTLPKQHRITWSTLWIIMYVMFYLYMDLIGAILYTPLLYIMYVTSIRFTEYDQYKEYNNRINQSISYKKTDQDNDNMNDMRLSISNNNFHWYGTGQLLWKSFIIHIVSWYIQIHVGHHIVEGATPASLVNLGAALTAAPLFAFYEGIWFCGLRQQLQQQVIAQVAIYTEQLCTSGANLRVCASL